MSWERVHSEADPLTGRMAHFEYDLEAKQRRIVFEGEIRVPLSMAPKEKPKEDEPNYKPPFMW